MKSTIKLVGVAQINQDGSLAVRRAVSTRRATKSSSRRNRRHHPIYALLCACPVLVLRDYSGIRLSHDCVQHLPSRLGEGPREYGEQWCSACVCSFFLCDCDRPGLQVVVQSDNIGTATYAGWSVTRPSDATGLWCGACENLLQLCHHRI